MATLADAIEAYLKQLLGAQSGYVEVRRCDLADSFSCAPSQINYVLETRFSTEHGYIVESRRGGGGYIRIRRVTMQPLSDLYTTVREVIGEQMSDVAAIRMLNRLVDAEIISKHRAEQILRFLMMETAAFNPPWNDYVRACAFKGMLLMLLPNPDGDEEGEEP